MKPKLKICGIKRVRDIEMVNTINPAFIGFVFAQSKRQIDLPLALSLKAKLNRSIKSVGVFVDEPMENVIKIAKSGAIDLIQLHGEETNCYIRELKSSVRLQVIKAIKMDGSQRESSNFPDAYFFLLDSGKGSGKTFDWSQQLKVNKPIFIAGGIGLENIAEANKFFHPYAFDVSSSVETNGVKNLLKMKELSEKIKTLNGEDNE
jgi:phosphoribosylanthranilate isomerase